MILALTEQFLIERPTFDPATGMARFGYSLGELHFVETLTLPAGADPVAATSRAFAKLLDLTAVVLGVSYFKLRAPFGIMAPAIPLTEAERAFAIDVYENGLGEFYARNNLQRFGKLSITAAADAEAAKPAPTKGGAAAPRGEPKAETKGQSKADARAEPKSAPPPAQQAKAKTKQADPVSRRSSEPVGGLPRVVPSEYIREAEEKQEADAQPAPQAAGAPTPISPPQQNFTRN